MSNNLKLKSLLLCLATSAALLVLAPIATPSAAQELKAVQSNGNLQLRGYGTAFMTGTTHFVDTLAQAPGRQPGLSVINQMHVQFMLPQAQKGKKHVPIVFVHGGGLSSKSWQTTPDGRMGWDEYFVRQGFDTYLGDQVSRARSGYDATKYNEVRNGAAPPADQAAILIATDQVAWTAFRWGTTTCTISPCATTTLPHPGIEFPMNTVGVGAGSNLQFFHQVVPDQLGTLPNPAFPGCAGSACLSPLPGAFANTAAQMAELAKQLGGATLVGHSQSSTYPTRAALQPGSGCFPWTSASACKVKGIIQLETGCFANLTAAEINTLKHIPILVVDGDYFTDQRPPASCVTMMNQISGAGGDMKYALLPALTPGSIYPGSPGPMPRIEHMMMVGLKNIEVANFLIGWATSRGL